jgi:type VI secretion system secreted protein VgrG
LSEVSSTGRTAGAANAAADWTQQSRLIAIETDLGKDRLLLTSLSGDESISRLFAYDVEMLSLDHSITAESLIGHKASITINTEDGQSRLIHGILAELRIGPLVTYDLRSYGARIVPWPWFLGHTTDCRIFQNLSVPEIVEKVFSIHGYTDFEMSVSRADYPKLEFCVQYRESAFNFVSRLMEQVGIFYFFRHEKDRHVLVMADANASFRDLPEPRLTYGSHDASGASIMGWERQVTQWEHTFGFRPGQWAQKDFNFETPSGDLRTTEKTLLKLRGADTIERFDYPGGYIDKGLGGKLTRTLMEAEEAAHHEVTGVSNYSQLCVGGKFTLRQHPAEDNQKAFVIRGIRHEAVDNSYLNATEPSRYKNKFTAMPYDTPFRPQRTIEKPFVHGPQTAIVVGPSGEKIYTDKFGRVRVQFHWDRYGQRDEKSSCWIRVSQSWAGRGWGAVNLPHVGHEVVVSFLEGDPDRPLVTGRVYNGENGTAMGMPDNKTQSAMRDHSGNEIVMEGKSGSEDIRVNATKDTNVVVTHDYNETVKTGNRTISISSGTHTETIKGDTNITVTTGALTVNIAANTATYISKNTTTMASTSADVQVLAKTQISLDVGSSHLLMKEDGTISLNAKNIIIHGSESVSISGNAIRSIADQEHETKGAITVSEGQTTNTVKGGMVMLNPGT